MHTNIHVHAYTCMHAHTHTHTHTHRRPLTGQREQEIYRSQEHLCRLSAFHVGDDAGMRIVAYQCTQSLHIKTSTHISLIYPHTCAYRAHTYKH